MTSKDYYFDSYAHFGIHEVRQNKRRWVCARSNLISFVGNVERRSPHTHIQKLYVPQPPFIQRQNCPWCWMWNWYSVHVCCQSWSQESHWRKLHSLPLCFNADLLMSLLLFLDW
jgi:hypothetical protein